MRIWSWQHVSCQCQHILCIHYWVEPSLLLSSSFSCHSSQHQQSSIWSINAMYVHLNQQQTNEQYRIYHKKNVMGSGVHSSTLDVLLSFNDTFTQRYQYKNPPHTHYNYTIKQLYHQKWLYNHSSGGTPGPQLCDLMQRWFDSVLASSRITPHQRHNTAVQANTV